MYSPPRRSRSYADDPIKLLQNLREFKNLKRDVDAGAKRVTTTIAAGEYYLSNADESITTILGAGISCAIRDKRQKFGGLNHFMQPNDKVLCWADELGCYTCNAMEILINGLLKLGAKREHLEARVFGGAYLSNGHNIGRYNVQYAIKYLDKEEIPVRVDDVGGTCVRRLTYRPFSDEVNIDRANQQDRDKAQQDDANYLQRLRLQDYFGGTELWL